jgi:hypothetical protein
LSPCDGRSSSLARPRFALGEARECFCCQIVKSASQFKTRHARKCIDCLKKYDRDWKNERYRSNVSFANAVKDRGARRRVLKAQEIRAYLKAWTDRNRDKCRGYWRKYAKSPKGWERARRARANAPYVFSIDATNNEGSWLGSNSMNPEIVLMNRQDHSDMVAKLASFKKSNPIEYANYCRELDIEDPLCSHN